MEFWIVFAVVAATAGLLVLRTVRRFRRALRGQNRCGEECDGSAALRRGSTLTPPEALVRSKRRRRPPKNSKGA